MRAWRMRMRRLRRVDETCRRRAVPRRSAAAAATGGRHLGVDTSCTTTTTSPGATSTTATTPLHPALYLLLLPASISACRRTSSRISIPLCPSRSRNAPAHLRINDRA